MVGSYMPFLAMQDINLIRTSGVEGLAMPVDMPPKKTQSRSHEATFNLWLRRSLNWLAVFVLASMCGWAYLLYAPSL
jgi:hypothetical protein